MTPTSRGTGRVRAQAKPRRPRPPLGQIVLVLGMVLAVTTAAYLLFIGWHRLSDVQAWAVWSFGAVFASVVACATWLRVGLIGGVGATVSTTLLSCLDVVTTHDRAVGGGPHWAAAVFAVLISAATGTCVVGAVVHAERLAYDRQRAAGERPKWLIDRLRRPRSKPAKDGRKTGRRAALR